jgi:hypothetical protein
VADEMFVDVGAQRSVAAVEALMGSSMSQLLRLLRGEGSGRGYSGVGECCGKPG